MNMAFSIVLEKDKIIVDTFTSTWKASIFLNVMFFFHIHFNIYCCLSIVERAFSNIE